MIYQHGKLCTRIFNVGVVVHAASIQDRDGAKLVFNKIYNSFPKLHVIWADSETMIYAAMTHLMLRRLARNRRCSTA